MSRQMDDTELMRLTGVVSDVRRNPRDNAARAEFAASFSFDTADALLREIDQLKMQATLSDMDKATIRGAIIMAQRKPDLAVSGVVGELVRIIQMRFCFPIYCYDEKWCRSLNGSARCSDCPVGNGNPSIQERIAMDERVRSEGLS